MLLRDYLKSRKITHEDFGKSVGVTRDAVARWLRKNRRPRPDVANRIVAETKNRVTLKDIYG
jgi:transcriptional regulator with XRE-family HTH domain